jgi:hypothetical protein
VEGLRSNWDEPRDPAALLADLTLGRACPARAAHQVERMHELLCCAGTTTVLRYYKYYHGTGFGKASTAEVRKFRWPIKALMQGDAS